MIPKIDPRVQLTFLEIKEEPVPGKVNFRMRMEGEFTDRLGCTFKGEYSMSLPEKVVVSDLPVEEPARSMALRRSPNWKCLSSARFKDGVAATTTEKRAKLSFWDHVASVKREFDSWPEWKKSLTIGAPPRGPAKAVSFRSADVAEVKDLFRRALGAEEGSKFDLFVEENLKI
jgi:hypothetical protein